MLRRSVCNIPARPPHPRCARYMADEARSLKAYGELPENIRVNDTDALNEEEGGENDDYIDFDDISGTPGSLLGPGPHVCVCVARQQMRLRCHTVVRVYWCAAGFGRQRMSAVDGTAAISCCVCHSVAAIILLLQLGCIVTFAVRPHPTPPTPFLSPCVLLCRNLGWHSHCRPLRSALMTRGRHAVRVHPGCASCMLPALACRPDAARGACFPAPSSFCFLCALLPRLILLLPLPPDFGRCPCPAVACAAGAAYACIHPLPPPPALCPKPVTVPSVVASHANAYSVTEADSHSCKSRALRPERILVSCCHSVPIIARYPHHE